MRSELQELAAVSRRLGSDLRYVFLGGGNTSFKDAETLYIKPSGVALSAIQPEQFIAMDREALQQLMQAPMPATQYPMEDRPPVVRNFWPFFIFHDWHATWKHDPVSTRIISSFDASSDSLSVK